MYLNVFSGRMTTYSCTQPRRENNMIAMYHTRQIAAKLVDTTESLVLMMETASLPSINGLELFLQTLYPGKYTVRTQANKTYRIPLWGFAGSRNKVNLGVVYLHNMTVYQGDELVIPLLNQIQTHLKHYRVIISRGYQNLQNCQFFIICHQQLRQS